jgi:hypothetical protein
MQSLLVCTATTRRRALARVCHAYARRRRRRRHARAYRRPVARVHYVGRRGGRVAGATARAAYGGVLTHHRRRERSHAAPRRRRVGAAPRRRHGGRIGGYYFSLTLYSYKKCMPDLSGLYLG